MKKIVIIILSLVTLAVYAQNPKKPYRHAKKLMDDKNYSEAIKELNEAISLDNEFINAYVLRAEAFEKTNEFEKAAYDYLEASLLDSKSVDYHFKAGKLFYHTQNYQKALESLTEAVVLDGKHFQALQYKAFSHIKVKEFQSAIVAINNALQLSETFLSYYTHGVAYDSLNNFNQAIIDYNKVITLNPDYEKAYFALSQAYLKNKQLNKALVIANNAVRRFTNNPEVYRNRSFIYHERGDLANAINDLTRLETMVDNDVNVLFKRGMYYFEYGQYQNAKSDFSQVLARSYNYIEALYWRAKVYEEMMLEEEAIRDYQRYLDFAANKQADPLYIAKANNRLFDLKNENVPPVIIVDTPRVVDGKLAVLNNSLELVIGGNILDKSEIKTLTINGLPVSLTNQENFYCILDISGIQKVELQAIDVYDNKSEQSYELQKMEINAPVVKLITPYAGDNGEIYLDSNDPNLFIEGKISDESLIKDIYINNIRASFNDKELNPRFTATIEIANRDRIDIVAIDAFNNVFETTYMLNRQGAIISENNPMGKTWVVFIENSNYENFASLEGPSQDANFIKRGLTDYQIHNFIHKKDLTKEELEKFFNIELRDQIKKNNIKSLMIWYAGHGKFINETGYWIPVDARPDDEFTYFNINTLRAGMQGYIGFITHTLLVTDACETGTAFYMATRSAKEIPSCSDAEATQFRSAQVLTSAGYELASDHSVFARTFAKTLMSNPEACIAIEKLVKNIHKNVPRSQPQQPKFGLIKGFEDEGGSFFFIKK